MLGELDAARIEAAHNVCVSLLRATQAEVALHGRSDPLLPDVIAEGFATALTVLAETNPDNRSALRRRVRVLLRTGSLRRSDDDGDGAAD